MSKTTLLPGARMPDGSVHVGVSPDTGRPIFVTASDMTLPICFNDAAKYAAQLDAHGHKDWRVPSKAELDVLLQNRAKVGGFGYETSNPTGWYWSSSEASEPHYTAWAQRHHDLYKCEIYRNYPAALRCVRG